MLSLMKSRKPPWSGVVVVIGAFVDLSDIGITVSVVDDILEILYKFQISNFKCFYSRLLRHDRYNKNFQSYIHSYILNTIQGR